MPRTTAILISVTGPDDVSRCTLAVPVGTGDNVNIRQAYGPKESPIFVDMVDLEVDDTGITVLIHDDPNRPS